MESVRFQTVKNSANRLQHLHNSANCSTRNSEESSAPGSKRKSYTPVTKSEKNKHQESFVVYKRLRGSCRKQQDKSKNLVSNPGTPSSLVGLEKSSQHSFQNVSRTYNKV